MADNDQLTPHVPLIAPYAEWAIATDFAFLEGDWFRVLLELRVSASAFAKGMDDIRVDDLVRVPPIYRSQSREFQKEESTFCMAIMTKDALRILVTGEGPGPDVYRLDPVKRKLIRIELGTPTKAIFDTDPSPVIADGLASNPPQRAVVAVIDDGLAFAHERFRSADRKYTRFKYFWNQDDPATNIVSGLGWGREFTEAEINQLLLKYGSAGPVDEDGLYQEAGQRLVARRAKHGTHVMDVACGLDADKVAANSPYLIGVQLPKWVTEETSGGLLTPLVHAAIAYILDRADQIAAQDGSAALPVVINLSYGTIAGPHDGTGTLEAALDYWVAAREPMAPLRIVLPAGNHYLARCHARFNLAAATAHHKPIQELHWRVQPDDKACSFAEIWLPMHAKNGTRPKVSFRIKPPNDHPSGWINHAAGGYWPWPSANKKKLLFEAKYYDIAGFRPWIRLAMAPTEMFPTPTVPTPRTAPSGTWRIEIRNDGGEIDVDAWVQRGDTPFGYPLSGRQSRFDDDKYERFDLAGRLKEDDNTASYIRRRGTLNALATGQYPIVIGSFRRSDRTASQYSGAGPVLTRPGPDAVAIGDDSVVMHGILAAGTRSGSVIALSGTSVAAPQVTRRISEWMTASLRSDRTAVHTLAAYDPGAPAPGSSDEERLGRGRIDGPEPIEFRWES